MLIHIVRRILKKSVEILLKRWRTYQCLKIKVLLVTGGTGSFGNALIRRFIKEDIKEIRILSRDEKKQDDMRKKYHDDRLKFFIGDVRNRDSLVHAVKGADYIFHAAALKQVPSCEFFPVEAVKTNVLGTDNVLEEAIAQGVEKVVCLSTDKVQPNQCDGDFKSNDGKDIHCESSYGR